MFSTEDTIVAVATPPGRGGIGVVRISGGAAVACASTVLKRPTPLAPRHATLVLVSVADAAEPSGRRTLDHAVATLFPGPHSYTGEDVVEISTHGSPVVLDALVQAVVAAGARVARPGEFTLRAFLNQRIDLTQAEAVADLIESATPLQAAAAFDQLQGTLTRSIAAIDAELFDLVARLEASVDFPDEGFHFVTPDEVRTTLASIADRLRRLIEGGRQGRILREGQVVAIVGGPNVGKSSLFNALLGSSRAIVTSVPGTTRDLVSETLDIDGLRVTLVDTAGIRETADVIESEGITRSNAAARVADALVVVRDGTTAEPPLDFPANNIVRVSNKSDGFAFRSHPDELAVSALTGDGMGELRRSIARALKGTDSVERPEVTNSRHLQLLVSAHSGLQRAVEALSTSAGMLPEEFLLADLQQARLALEAITGRRTSDDVLTHIFERFCIGK